MKNRILILTTTVIFFVLTGCSTQQNSTTGVPTPTPQAVEIPAIPEPVLFTYGYAKGMAWSADSQQLSILVNKKIINFSSSDWNPTGEIPVDGIDSTYPFAVDGNTVRAVYSTIGSRVSNLRAYDQSTGSVKSDDALGSETGDRITGLSVEQGLYVMPSYICSDVNQTLPCVDHFDLYTIKENKRLFALFEYRHELYDSGTVFQYSPDGRYLAAGADDNQLRVWDIKQRKLIFSSDHDGDIYDLDFSSDGRLLLSASNDATARIWDLALGKELARVDHLTGGVQYARFLNQDTDILIGLTNGAYSRWEFDRTGMQIHNPRVLFSIEPEFYRTPIPPTISISPDEKWIAMINLYHVDVWDLETGQALGPLPGFSSHPTKVILSPDGRYLAYTDEKHVYLFQTHPFRYIGALPGPEQKYYAISFVGSQPILAANGAGILITWNFVTGGVEKFDKEKNHHCLNMQTISKDGKLLASIDNGKIDICDVVTLTPISSVEKREFGLEAYLFTEDGSGLFDLRGQSTQFIDTATGKEIYQISVSDDGVSKQGNLLLTFPSLTLYNIDTGASQKTATDIGPSEYAALNRNGRLVAASNSEGIGLYDILTGRLWQTIKDCDLTGLYFSEGDDILYGTHSTGVLKAWDLSALANPETYARILQIPPTATNVPCSSGQTQATPIPTPSPAPTEIPNLSATPIAPDEQTNNEWIYRTVENFGSPNPFTSTWSSDEELVAVGIVNRIEIFDVNTSKKLISIPAMSEPFAMSFSHDHNLFADQIVNDRVELWDISTGILLHSFSDIGCTIHSLEFSQDDNTITADCGSEIYTWDTKTGERIYLSIEDQPTQELIGRDGISLRLLNQNGEILKTFEYPNQSPEKYQFSDDGKLLFIAFHSYRIAHSGAITDEYNQPAPGQIWDISDRENPVLLTTIFTPNWNGDPYYFMDSPIGYFTSDNRYLFTSLDDETIRIWEVNTGNLISEIPGTSDFVFSKDQNRLETFDSTGGISIWDISDRQHPVRTWQLAYSYPKIQQVLFTNSHDEIILLNGQTFSSHPLRYGIIQTTQESIHLPYRVDQVITASLDGRWIGINQHGSVSICDRNQASIPCTSLFTFPDVDVYLEPVDLVFSPDSRWLAASTPTGRVIYWDISTLTFHDLSNKSRFYNLEFDQSGEHLLASSVLGDAVLVDFKSGNVINTYSQMGDINLIAPDGKELVAIHQNSNEIIVIDLGDGKTVQTFNNSHMIKTAALQPDGNHLIFSDTAGTYNLDLATGKIINQIDSVFYTIAISPDGSIMVTVDADGQIQVWK